MTNLEREDYNEYLEKPLELAMGELSTQVNLSATSISTGGITGKLIIKSTGKIVVENNAGIEVVTIDQTGMTVTDGTINRVKIGDIS